MNEKTLKKKESPVSKILMIVAAIGLFLIARRSLMGMIIFAIFFAVIIPLAFIVRKTNLQGVIKAKLLTLDKNGGKITVSRTRAIIRLVIGTAILIVNIYYKNFILAKYANTSEYGIYLQYSTLLFLAFIGFVCLCGFTRGAVISGIFAKHMTWIIFVPAAGILVWVFLYFLVFAVASFFYGAKTTIRGLVVGY